MVLSISMRRMLALVVMVCLLLPTLPADAAAGENILILENGFEDGTTQGWTGRGDSGEEILTSETGIAARSGSRGLHVSGRTESWHGAVLDVTSYLEVGQTYVFTGWIKLATGSNTVYLSMDTTKGDSRTFTQLYTETASSNNWVKFVGEYRHRESADQVAVYFEVPDNPTMAFYLDDFRMEQLPDRGPISIETDIPSLKDVFADAFLIGSSFENYELIEEADRQLLTKHFNSVTPGNVLKWDSTEPEEGVFDFPDSDEAVQFAIENGQRIRGHTLIWHNQTPDWVFYDENGNLATKELLYQRMENHIKTVVGRYKGQIYAWDVVNEVLDASQPDGLRRSLWYEIAGEGYIEKAFQFAHEADPGALLFINDYNTHESGKSQAMYDLISRLLAKGIPVHGVGHQTHLKINYPTMSEIDRSIAKFADLGIKTEITELDIDVYSDSNTAYETLPEDVAQTQATRYKQLFDILVKHKDMIDNVTLWGKDDGNTWLRSFPVNRNNWPLLFDERLQSKPAYWAIVGEAVPVPAVPQNLTAEAGHTEIVLRWDMANRAASYNVKRATEPGGPYTTIASDVAWNSYTDTGLANGTTYYYVVSAANRAGESANSAEAAATPQLPPLPGEFVLSAAAGNAKVDLSWTEASHADSYDILRAVSGTGAFTEIASALTGSTYSDLSAANGSTYDYKVRANNVTGSTESNTVSAMPELPAPGSFTLSAAGGDAEVALSWTASSDADSYSIQRAASQGGPYTVIASGVTETGHTDSEVVNDETYFYIVTAVNSSGSTDSNEASATPSMPKDLQLHYRVGDASAVDGQLKPQFNIFNHGSEPVPLSELSIRYWYAKEGDHAQEYHCDYAVIGCANVNGTFGTASSPANGADSYMEIRFDAGAGTLAAGGSTGEIQNRVNDTNWSNYDETNDYSYNGTQTAFAAWDKATLYRRGILIWGTEPVSDGESDPDPTAPEAPVGVTAVLGANNVVVVQWQPSAGAESYNVKRADVVGGPYTTIATGVTALSYTDAYTSGSHYYVVSAVNGAGESANSSAAPILVADPLPTVPTGLAAEAGDGQITVSWNPSEHASGYRVKRAESSGGPYTTIASNITETFFTDSSVTNGSTYYYVVSALGFGESGNSSEVSATPQGSVVDPPGNLVIQYRAGDASATDNQMKPYMRIVNNGSDSVDLSNLKLRYYFSLEEDKAQNIFCDWATVGCANTQRTVVELASPANGATHYLEVGYTSGAGSLAAGANSGELQLRIHNSDWSQYNEANDYSYDAQATSFADWDRVTLYQNGQLVWGIEP